MGFVRLKFLDPRHKVSSQSTSVFFSLRSSLKDTNARRGGRARSRVSLEMFYMCRTKVICKQKRNPIESGLLRRSTAPCLSVPRACLITFKQHFQTAFWESCQHFSFLGKFSKQFGFCRLYFFSIRALNNWCFASSSTQFLPTELDWEDDECCDIIQHS